MPNNNRSPAAVPEGFLKRFRGVGAVILLYFLSAIAQSWPLALNWATHIPLGTEISATVPLFILWTLRWNSLWFLGQASGSYWDAPIFYPATGTLALSGAQPITGLIFTAFQWPSANPILAYNLVFLAIQTLNGYAAWRLANRLGLPTGPAILTGLLAQSLPFVGRELGVLQLTVLFPIFLVLEALWDFHRQPRLSPALAMGGWTAVTFLTVTQYALFLTLFLLLGGVLFIQRQHLRRRSIGSLLAGVVLASLLLAPVIPAQFRVTSQYRRSETTISRNSAQVVDYLRLNGYAWGAGTMPWLNNSRGSGQRLYPGSGLLVLAGLGVIASRRRIVAGRWILFCGLGVILAFLISLGPNLTIGTWVPYDLIRAYYPGFGQLRSPFRLAVFTQIFLLGLAGPGLAVLWQWRGRLGRALAVLFVSLGMLEILVLPARLFPAEPAIEQLPWISWLGGRPQDVVAMLPLPRDGRTASFEPTVLWMNQALMHGHKLVNGYSSFFPPPYYRLEEQMESFPGSDSLAALQRAGVTYLVIDQEWLTAATAQKLRAAPQIDLIYSDAMKAIYQLSPMTSPR